MLESAGITYLPVLLCLNHALMSHRSSFTSRIVMLMVAMVTLLQRMVRSPSLLRWNYNASKMIMLVYFQSLCTQLIAAPSVYLSIPSP